MFVVVLLKWPLTPRSVTVNADASVATWLRFANQPDITALLGLSWFREREMWADDALAVSLFSAMFEVLNTSSSVREGTYSCGCTCDTIGRGLGVGVSHAVTPFV